MLSQFFQHKPLVDESSRQWILDGFAWAIEHFNVDFFLNESQLILPDNEFYSGRVNSVDEMAQNIFDHTLEYCGMKNWPIKLVKPQSYNSNSLPLLNVSGALRGKHSKVTVIEGHEVISFTYNPSQINQPQDLIASYVQQLATLLVMQQKVLPPGGKDFLPQAIDLLASVMGFGVIFSNTAYQFKGGCGSCYNPRANRQAALPENEMLYCLALFCYLKDIQPKQVKKHLKGHLRSQFKKMTADVAKQFKGEKNHPLFLIKSDI